MTEQLKKHGFLENQSTNILNEKDVEGFIYSWLKMSNYDKEKLLYMTDFYNFYDYFHNIIAKIEANLI